MKSARVAPPRARRRPAQKKPRILCVDDNGGLRDVICRILSIAGFHCETVADGEAALERLTGSGDEVDILITDHSMPGLDGLRLVTQLRNNGFNGKIIVQSAWLRPHERVAYNALRADAILTKPIDPDQLLRTVSELSSHNGG